MNDHISYSVDRDDLVVLSGSREVWRGRPGGSPVASAMRLRSSNDAVVTHKIVFESGMAYNNLIRCTPDGDIVWIAGQHGVIPDGYGGAYYQGDSLFTQTYEGFTCQIDENNGNIISTEYTR